MTFVIRPVELSDVPALVEIENQSFGTPNWKARDFVKYDCWVAQTDKEIAGFIVSRQVFAGDTSSPAQREILNVAVASPFRRRGVATALISKELERSGEVFLEVRESNWPARELYRKLGFREVGQRPKYYQSPFETAIVMKMK